MKTEKEQRKNTQLKPQTTESITILSPLTTLRRKRDGFILQFQTQAYPGFYNGGGSRVGGRARAAGEAVTGQLADKPTRG